MILYKNFIFVFSLALLLCFAVSTTATTIELPNPLCTGGPGSPGCVNDFPSLIAKITQFFTIIIGGLAVIMFIWAGILFVTSAGNDTKLANAKTAVWWAVVGTAIALA